MTSKQQQALADERSLAYQSQASALAASVHTAAYRAELDLTYQMESLLTAYQRKAGFKTREEALAWLFKPITSSQQMQLLAQKKLNAITLEEYNTRASEAYRARYTRIGAMKEYANLNAKKLAKQLKSTTSAKLMNTVADGYSRQIFSIQKGLNAGFSFTALPASSMQAIANKVLPMSTALRFATSMSDQVREIFVSGLLSGKNVKDIAKDLQPITQQTTYQAKRLARTVLTSASNEGEQQALRELGIKKYEYVATLDEKTCPICGEHDGREYAVSDGEAGVNLPPMHPNCRCTTVAVMSKEKRERLKRAARDEEGKTIAVPRDMSYEQWKARNEAITSKTSNTAKTIG